jgi:hypothetical protein
MAARRFDGVDDRIVVPAPMPAANGWSAAMLIRPTRLTNGYLFHTLNGSAPAGYALGLDETGALRMWSSIGDTEGVSPPGFLRAGVWSFVLATVINAVATVPYFQRYDFDDQTWLRVTPTGFVTTSVATTAIVLGERGAMRYAGDLAALAIWTRPLVAETATSLQSVRKLNDWPAVAAPDALMLFNQLQMTDPVTERITGTGASETVGTSIVYDPPPIPYIGPSVNVNSGGLWYERALQARSTTIWQAPRSVRVAR